MPQPCEIESQGDHQYVVRLHSHGDVIESWFNLTPSALQQLGAGQAEEERVVRQTVAFLTRHQDAADFPQVVELEDVMSSYDDYITVMTR
jgi:hypothetical protein